MRHESLQNVSFWDSCVSRAAVSPLGASFCGGPAAAKTGEAMADAHRASTYRDGEGKAASQEVAFLLT
jgi:hypothetical protein